MVPLLRGLLQGLNRSYLSLIIDTCRATPELARGQAWGNIHLGYPLARPTELCSTEAGPFLHRCLPRA